MRCIDSLSSELDSLSTGSLVPMLSIKEYLPLGDLVSPYVPEFYQEATADTLNEWADNGLLLASIMYALCIGPVRFLTGYGSHYTKHRSGWKLFMFTYNIVMSVYSLVTLVVMAREWTTFSLYDISDETSEVGAVFKRHMFERAVYFFYMSKYVEYLDTIFLVVMNKNVSWLQYYHHLGVVPCMHLMWFYRNPLSVIWCTFNAFIHTIMYAYFASCVYGYKVPGFFKPMLTFLQLSQFVVGLYVGKHLENLKGFNSSPHYMLSARFENTYLYILILLFAQFFYTSYIAKPSAAKKKAD